MLIKLKPEEYFKTTIKGIREDEDKPYSDGYVYICYKKDASVNDECIVICYTTDDTTKDRKEFYDYCNLIRPVIGKDYPDYVFLVTKGANFSSNRILIL